MLAACGRRADEGSPPPPARDAGVDPSTPLPERIDAALSRAGGFLLGKQGADGAIRSGTYAYFKDGYSLTPLALAALFGVPDDPAAERGYARGADFLATMIGADGKLRSDRDAPRYPTYSMAIGVIVLNLPRNQRHRRTRDALVAALRERQLLEARGWAAGDPAHGSWSYFDGLPDRPPGPLPEELSSTLPGNLSVTLFAIGALFLSGVPATDPALVAARGFVERCQNPDGGFQFSPSIPDANKAGPGRSYGSMTADGARALLRLGATPDDPKLIAARRWLERWFDAERNPGDFVEVNEVRRASSYYYWTWSAAHAMRDLGIAPERWAAPLARALLTRQRGDGSWANPATEMREDDPVVASSFATAALAVCRMALGGPAKSHAAGR